MKKNCTKVSYYSKERAEKALRTLLENSNLRSAYVPTATYRCNTCRKFHLTSKPQKMYYNR